VEPVPDGFPETVEIKSPTRTFNSIFFFALDERGRIWAKPIEKTRETDGFAPGWQLFGTGLPENAQKPGFAKPARIVAIQGDADEVMAVSDERRMYSMRWLPNPVFAGTPRQWTDTQGWPVEGPAVWDDRVKENRGWGIGRRNQIVGFFEDVDGKSFTGGGGLTTYYFLSKDGTEIYFSDSGLPPDWSHTMEGPRRGTFVAEGFDVSASTMFVIDRQGEMFTRLADFDTNGSDIMFFDYTYDRSNKTRNVIAIPSEDWLRHEKIPLAGEARISSQITIALTGQHNQGRELRVAGRDAAGRTGYYRKAIFFQKKESPEREAVKTWEFHPLPSLALDPARILDPDDCRRKEPASGAPSRDVLMSGTLEADGKPVPVELTLLDWNLETSPATLRLTSGDEHVDLVFHTVEEWFHLKRFDPGRDGTPKKLLGTLEVPKAVWAAAPARLRKVLNDVLALYDLRDHAFWVEATTDYVAVETRDRPRQGPLLTLSFTRSGGGHRTLESAKREALHGDGFTRAASSPRLEVGGPLKTFQDAGALAKKIELNEAARTELRSAFEAPTALDRETPFYVTQPGILGVKTLSTLLGGAGLWAPYVRNLMGELPSLIVKNDELKATVLCVSREDFDRAIAILETRLAAYRRRLAEIDGKVSVGPWIYAETVAGFWDGFRFGARTATAHGALNRGVPGECRITVDDGELGDLPELEAEAGRRPRPRGLTLSVVCAAYDGSAAGKLRFRVTPRDLGKRIFEQSLRGGLPVGAAGNRLVLEATVALEYFDDMPRARTLLESMFPSPADRRAEETRGTLTIEGGKYALSLDGFVIDWER
jgi:hypothetical protein